MANAPGHNLNTHMGFVNPSIAIKFLRDFTFAGNQLAMVTFDMPWPPSYNFWENDFLSQVPDFTSTCQRDSLARFNAEATPFIFTNGHKRMAVNEEDGTRVKTADRKFPFFIRYEPIRANLPATDDKSRWFQQLEGEEAIPTGTHIFDVYALENHNGTTDPNSTPEDQVKIGEVWTTSAFTQSLWGDERLFFQHSKLERDFEDREDRGENVD